MKAASFLTLVFAVLAGSAYSQTFEMTKSVKHDEVPALILKSFQKDFPNLPNNGIWELKYNEDLNTKRLTPELYTYSCKTNGVRVTLFYKVDGTLDHTKGIEHHTDGTHP